MGRMILNGVLSAAAMLTVSCTSTYRDGMENYHEGMESLQSELPTARAYLEVAEQDMAEAMKAGLDPEQSVTAASIRARALIELDRHADAAALLSQRIEGYAPARSVEGDIVGLALVKAHHLDPERAYAELVLAEHYAQTLRSRLHLAWQQARTLRKLGTPKAKAEALRICDQNPGRLDFDAMRAELEK